MITNTKALKFLNEEKSEITYVTYVPKHGQVVLGIYLEPDENKVRRFIPVPQGALPTAVVAGRYHSKTNMEIAEMLAMQMGGFPAVLFSQRARLEV